MFWGSSCFLHKLCQVWWWIGRTTHTLGWRWQRNPCLQPVFAFSSEKVISFAFWPHQEASIPHKIERQLVAWLQLAQSDYNNAPHSQCYITTPCLGTIPDDLQVGTWGFRTEAGTRRCHSCEHCASCKARLGKSAQPLDHICCHPLT